MTQMLTVIVQTGILHLDLPEHLNFQNLACISIYIILLTIYLSWSPHSVLLVFSGVDRLSL